MLKNKIAILILVLGTALTLISPRLALADVKNQLQNGVDAAAGGAPTCTVDGHAGTPGECSKKSVDDTVSTIVNLLSSIIAVVAVIVIIIAGFRFVTSAGNSEGVGKAKNAILYAIVGLAVAAFAQLIVRFVLHSV
jgi:hypothetical protein